MKAGLPALVAALIVAAPAGAQTTGTAGDATPQPEVPARTRQGLYVKPDAGVVYQSGDFRLTAWGFAERLIDPEWTRHLPARPAGRGDRLAAHRRSPSHRRRL